MNFKVDLVALIPYFFSIILAGLEDLDIIGKAGKIIRLLRIMRILLREPCQEVPVELLVQQN